MSEPERPEPPSKPGPAGRVKHDASGRAVWEWAVDTGRHALDSTSRLLKRLELPGLSLEDEAGKKKQEGKEADAGAPTFGGPREVGSQARTAELQSLRQPGAEQTQRHPEPSVRKDGQTARSRGACAPQTRISRETAGQALIRARLRHAASALLRSRP